MHFHQHQAIYLQIVDHMVEMILKKEWGNDARIPAIREMAVAVQVNPNTVMRAYAYLEDKNIIYKQRGIGYFVVKDADKKILAFKKTEFIKNVVPAFFKKMELAGITLEDLSAQFDQAGENSEKK
ncbi:MAG: transcriptional regulator, GntR family [uncultured bacterium]|nr:MAG: transcriptional regulator, GntR family [uncultured bacterium]